MDEPIEDEDDDAGATPPSLAPLEIEVLPEQVSGYPLHAALTLRTGEPGAILNRLPWISFFSTDPALACAFFDPVTRDRVSGQRPPPPRVADMDDMGLELRGDRPTRVLLDLGSVPVLAPGPYLLQVYYSAMIAGAESAFTPLVVRAPTAQERAVLGALASERARAGDWSSWSRLPAGDPASLRGPFAPDDPLRYNRVLRYLYHGESDLADADPRFLEVLTGLYTPEADLLRAEIAKARGDAASLTRFLTSALAASPGLHAWARSIESGSSDLQWTNDERRRQRLRGRKGP